jgi:hypothetical protein
VVVGSSMAQRAALQGLLAANTRVAAGDVTQQPSRKPPAKGEGLGGAGTSNKCVPCTRTTAWSPRWRT